MQKKELILKSISQKAFEFIERNVTLDQTAQIFSTNTLFNIESVESHPKSVVNLKRVNDFQGINRYFRLVNKKLPTGGLFVSFVETYAVRKQRLLNKFPFPFNRIYYGLDVFITRITPKISITKRLYYYLSTGKGRVLSRTEVLGRLYYCGFEVMNEEVIDNKLYFVAKKTKDPIFSIHKPSYGFIIKLPRVGKNGKIISVYKFRTMHPYSEYLQQYVFEKNSLEKGGKLKDDFRVSTVGRIFRKYWLDELPMIWNLVRGDMKLIGVRPLSQHYMSLYSRDIKRLRKKTKPGLLPPFYADMPTTLDEIMESERKYCEAYLRNPIRTDIQYFFRILNSILLKGKRSA
jgi:lipopolysaccharide/colanic/teichoic acid biosynthesis glycosyltransferase